MLKLKDKVTIAFAVASTILLVVAMACSIYFAAFTANKTATTTLKFHEGIELTIKAGIDTNGKWIYNTTGATSGFKTPTEGCPTTVPLDGLALSNIVVQANTDCYIRVFVVIATDATDILNEEGEVISDVDLAAPTFDFTDTGSDALIGNEQEFLNGITTEKVSAVGITQATGTNSIVNILQAYQVFDANDYTDTTNPYYGHTVKAYISIYASTTDGEWGTPFTCSFETN